MYKIGFQYNTNLSKDIELKPFFVHLDGTMKLNKSTATPGNIRPFIILQGYRIYNAGQRCQICGLLHMFAGYVAIWLPRYGVKKDTLN